MNLNLHGSIQQAANEAWHQAFSFPGNYSSRPLPVFLARLIEAGRREAAATATMRTAGSSPDDFNLLEDFVEDDLALEKKSGLAAFEARVADRLGRAADCMHPELWKLAASMRLCRQQGHVGIVEGGGYQIAWSSKCGSALFCPHESRADAKRVEGKYHDPLLDHLKRSKLNELHYAVLTIPNVPAGALRQGLDRIQARFKAVFLSKHFPAIDNIDAALSIVECPVSRHGDWNVHLNVFFLVHGRPDYRLMRQCWGFDMEIQRVSPDKVSDTFREMVKYVLTGGAEKSEQKTGSGAPAFCDWTDDQIREYWDAHQSFRKLRAYGALYAVHGKRWNGKGLPADKRDYRRARFIVDALTYDPDLPSVLVRQDWTDIADDHKAALRLAMDNGPKPAGVVKWIGKVNFDALRLSYRVDLVLGDNFFSNSRSGGQFSTGPPGRGGGVDALH